MGYLFLSVALISGAVKGFCGKKISGSAKELSDSISANLVRMFFCIIIGFVIVLASGKLSQAMPTAELLLITGISGVSSAVFVVSWLLSVRKSAYMLLDVFLMTGTLIPIIGSNILFSESIKLTQCIGLLLLFVAAALMCSYNNSIKTKMTLSGFLLLLLCGVSNGVTDFSQKLFVKTLSDISISVFNLYTYIFAMITLLITYLLIKKPNTDSNNIISSGTGVYILIMAICLFMNSFFKTLAATYLDSALLYPLNQGLSLIISTAMSAVLFREKLTLKAGVGIIIAFAGLLCINLL